MAKAETTSIFINEVADLTSVTFAQKLVDKFCGRRVYIPLKVPHEKHYLCRALNFEELEILVDNFGGQTLEIPMSLTNEAPIRKARILELRAKKYSIQDIASQTNCCWRWVHKVVQKEQQRHENEKNQMNLFNESE